MAVAEEVQEEVEVGDGVADGGKLLYHAKSPAPVPSALAASTATCRGARGKVSVVGVPLRRQLKHTPRLVM